MGGVIVGVGASDASGGGRATIRFPCAVDRPLQLHSVQVCW